MLSVRFWGVRGSMPCPGPDTVVYGGNTSCLEIHAGDRLVIIDLGTGIRPLGDCLLSKDYLKSHVDADIFISHTHWDHIMGFPMFTPLFNPATKLRIWGPVSSDDDKLESIIGAHFSHRYWPVRVSELAAKIEYAEIKEGIMELGGGLVVRTKSLNHPLPCLGYRIEYQDKSIVTVFDHEPFCENAAEEKNEEIRRFFENADVLIHDGQYTAAEFPNRLGWGHSSLEGVYNQALKSGIKKLVFFHHDTNRTDKQLEALENEYKAKADKTGMEVFMAREGLTLEA